MGGYKTVYQTEYVCPHCGYEGEDYTLRPPEFEVCAKCGTFFDKDGKTLKEPE